MSRHYRVREGSLIDKMRYGMAGIGFWAVIIGTFYLTYM